MSGATISRFRVFVASPGDAAHERQIAREVIVSLNPSVNHRLGSHGGFVLEPVGRRRTPAWTPSEKRIVIAS